MVRPRTLRASLIWFARSGARPQQAQRRSRAVRALDPPPSGPVEVRLPHGQTLHLDTTTTADEAAVEAVARQLGATRRTRDAVFLNPEQLAGHLGLPRPLHALVELDEWQHPASGEFTVAGRSGDQLFVTMLDRFGRCLEHLIDLSNDSRSRGVDLIVLAQGIDTSTAVGRMFFQFLGAIAEFEPARCPSAPATASLRHPLIVVSAAAQVRGEWPGQQHPGDGGLLG